MPVCACTKEAVNLTVSAGRTSSCPIVHLGKEPSSNNIELLSVVGSCRLQEQRPDASTSKQLESRETPVNEGSHHPPPKIQCFTNAMLHDSVILLNNSTRLNFIQFRQELFQLQRLIVQYLSAFLPLQMGKHLI